MSLNSKDINFPAVDQALKAQFDQSNEYNKKVLVAEQACSREPVSVIIRNNATHLRRKADRLENLAKVMDMLPAEIENVLYPIIHDYIYRPDSRY